MSKGNVELQRELIMTAVRAKGRPLTRAEMEAVKADAASLTKYSKYSSTRKESK